MERNHEDFVRKTILSAFVKRREEKTPPSKKGCRDTGNQQYGGKLVSDG